MFHPAGARLSKGGVRWRLGLSLLSAALISNRIPRSVSRPLEGLGCEVVRNPFGYTIASVHGIRINGERLEGGDPDALCRAALLGLGLGVALVAMPHALPHLESGALLRLLPRWYANGGPISLYFDGAAATGQDPRFRRLRGRRFRAGAPGTRLLGVLNQPSPSNGPRKL